MDGSGLATVKINVHMFIFPNTFLFADELVHRAELCRRVSPSCVHRPALSETFFTKGHMVFEKRLDLSFALSSEHPSWSCIFCLYDLTKRFFTDSCLISVTGNIQLSLSAFHAFAVYCLILSNQGYTRWVFSDQ